ncbi:hypothetical protein BASA60_002135 [Batrachochytrium salamandrivorans]|nr:hypothetical protein BASA60_002135 [Batrachochytrium salamandrivorans]
MTNIAQMLGQLKIEASNTLLQVVDVALQAAMLPIVSLPSAKYYCLVCNDPVFFTSAIEQIGSTSNPPVTDITGQFLDRWLEKVDAIGHGKQRKLAALAMCSLLGSGHPAVWARIDAVLGMLTGIMSQFHNMSSDEAATFAYKVRDEDDDEHSLDDARQDLLMSWTLFLRMIHCLIPCEQIWHLLSRSSGDNNSCSISFRWQTQIYSFNCSTLRNDQPKKKLVI